jgi:hypothetical protein
LAALRELDAGNESGCNCAEANGENTELSFGGGNGAGFRHVFRLGHKILSKF